MDQRTRQILLDCNREFYDSVYTSFDETRKTAWAGWDRVAESLHNRLRTATMSDSSKAPGIDRVVRHLDLGCGNGRWGSYVADSLQSQQNAAPVEHWYTGVEQNKPLVRIAARNLLSRFSRLTLHNRDIFDLSDSPVMAEKYDSVTLFGVWHHLPGRQWRSDLLKQLAEQLSDRGMLAISCWRFLRSEQLRSRLVTPEAKGIRPQQLEGDDYLLDWRADKKAGGSAVRYCQDTRPEELASAAASAGLRLLDNYAADGKTGNLNDYYIFAREI